MTAEGKLSLRATYAEMWRVYRRHWTFLVPAAIVVLLPQSLGDAFLEGFEVEHLRTFADFATIGGALVTAAINFFGQAVYAGLATAAVIDWRAGRPLPRLSALLRAMPIGRLVVLDIVINLLVAIGFSLLFVPGLIVLTYIAISPAVMKIEHLGVQDSISRSIQLVRGRARQVFVIAIGAIIFSEIAVELVSLPFSGWAVLAIVNLIAEGIFQPIEGLAIALVAIHLLELHGEARAPDEMAAALVAEHD